MAFLESMKPKQFTYLGFAFAALGALLCLVAILSIFNVLGLRVLSWPLVAFSSIACIGIATYCFQRMGKKKVEL